MSRGRRIRRRMRRPAPPTEKWSHATSPGFPTWEAPAATPSPHLPSATPRSPRCMAVAALTTAIDSLRLNKLELTLPGRRRDGARPGERRPGGRVASSCCSREGSAGAEAPHRDLQRLLHSVHKGPWRKVKRAAGHGQGHFSFHPPIGSSERGVRPRAPQATAAAAPPPPLSPSDSSFILNLLLLLLLLLCLSSLSSVSLSSPSVFPARIRCYL